MSSVTIAHPAFEIEGKSRAWHTAFFYLAEHVRFITGGAINHKALYALVGTDGRYYNHENPTVRKRTAGALSRVVHTNRYVKDMQAAYTQDGSVFRSAALEVCAQVGFARSFGDSEIAEYLRECCWPDVRKGLQNEKEAWRNDLDLIRIDQEARVLLTGQVDPSISAVDEVEGQAADMFAGLLAIVAFGHLDLRFARSLLDEEPTGIMPAIGDTEGNVSGACLVKFSDSKRTALAGMWRIPQDRPFTVGRYTDCDAVEDDRALSRIHCCVYKKAGSWWFEDLGSRNGSRILRKGGGCVFDSSLDGSRVPYALRYGDAIVLANQSFYWFGSLSARHQNRAQEIEFGFIGPYGAGR